MSYGQPPQPLRPARPTGLIVGVVVASVVVLGLCAAGVAAYALTRPEPAPGTGPAAAPDEPDVLPSDADLRAVAQAYVDAVNEGDEAAATALTCERTGAGELWSMRDATVEREYVWVIGESQVDQSALGAGQAWVRIGIEGNDPQRFPQAPFDVREGTWCVVW